MPIVALPVDRLSSDAALTQALEGRADGDALVFAWPKNRGLLHCFFVQSDHHEIAATWRAVLSWLRRRVCCRW